MAIGTTRSKRRLGRYIAPLVERTERKHEDIGKEAHCSRQTIARLVGGEHLPGFHRFMTILSVLRVSEDERERALRLHHVAEGPTATISHEQDLGPAYVRFRMDETEAVLEQALDTVIIPGLLQTAAYAEAVARGARKLIISECWNEQAAAERQERQDLLTRDPNPLALHALIDEAALRRMVGSREVMADQLDHLLAMAKKPTITIQVVPFSVGAYGATSGPITILNYPEDDEPQSVYIESMTGGDNVENVDGVAALNAVWDDVSRAALSARKSAEFIRQVRTTDYGPREDLA